MKVRERFPNWKMPKIEHNKPTIYNWVVSYPENLKLAKYTDIGALVYICSKYGIEIEEEVEIGSHCSIYSYDTIGNKKGKGGKVEVIHGS